MNTPLRLFLIGALAFGAHAAGAESFRLKCEFWHKRLGQQDDQTYLIDLGAKTCNGSPCKISDAELGWQAEGGRAEFKIDRIAGEGSFVYLTDELGQLKNCKAAS